MIRFARGWIPPMNVGVNGANPGMQLYPSDAVSQFREHALPFPGSPGKYEGQSEDRHELHTFKVDDKWSQSNKLPPTGSPASNA
jgi:hypothetical protein